MENSSKPDNRQVAQENELKTLKVVRHFGHLRRSEIATAVWPDSPKGSALEMARVTLSRLIEKKLLIRRKNSFYSDSYVLTVGGAKFLSSLGFPSGSGYSIKGVAGPQFFHRTLGTVFLLEKYREGMEPYGEYAIAHEWAPVSRLETGKRYGKFPDGVLLREGEKAHFHGVPYLAHWVEVESAFKSLDEFKRILEIAWHSGEWLDRDQTIMLDKLYVVYDKSSAHEKGLIRAMKSLVKEHGKENLDEILYSIILTEADIKYPMTVNSFQERHMLDFKKDILSG